MTNLNKNFQGKQEFKTKVGHLMEEYERSQQDEILQKQQLKQNIMMQLMNKRKQQSPNPPLKAELQNKSQTSNTAHSEPQQLQFPNLQALPQVTFNPAELKPTFGTVTNSVPKSQEIRRQESQEIRQSEANMKKRNKSLQGQLSYINSQVHEKPKDDHNEEEELNKSINRIAKYANKYFPSHFKEEMQPEKTLEQNQKVQEEYEDYRKDPRADKSSYLESYYAGKSSYIPPPQSKHSDKTPHVQDYQPEEENEIQAQQIQEEEDNNRGVFLTMQESQSMTASELPKNVAFEIKMDKSVDPDHLEELRKQKIKEMQKRNQERRNEFRKQEAQKKVQMPRGRSSHALKHDKIQKEEEIEPEVPKSTVSQRKSYKPPKIENKSERQPNKNLIPLDTYNSQFQAKQNKPPKYSNKDSYVQVQQSQQRPISPLRTPKTIVSENRPKSSYKNTNIFGGESQYTRQKSASRIPDPKIEPKDRKHSFSRQSNKKLMINAITYVCFPGELNRKDRQRLIEVLESSQHEFFVFLFKEYTRKLIKGIYILDNSQTRLEKIYGDKAPFEITADKVKQFYRFDSGSREFKKVDGCRSFSFIIHAVDHR